jgi:hypothetical protein
MRRLLLLCFLLGMTGCSPSFVVVNPDYASGSCRDRTLTLLPPAGDLISIIDTVDVHKNFPDDRRSGGAIVRDSCYATMLRNLSSRLQGIRFDTSTIFPGDTFKDLTDTSCFLALQYDAGKDSLPLTFYLPSAACIGKDIDIGLVFNQLTFSRDDGRTGIPLPGATVLGGSPPTLNADIMFLIWDYKKDRPIAYGRTAAGQTFIFGMTHATWNDLFRKTIEAVLKDTPFGLRKGNGE